MIEVARLKRYVCVMSGVELTFEVMAYDEDTARKHVLLKDIRDDTLFKTLTVIGFPMQVEVKEVTQ